ncbi:MAG: hypothetical protein K6G00_06010 [Treponema sp.]|nr:hypothetical protein [Treponema sp.]
MKQNTLSVYLMASLAMLVPFPGRLAYGIILIVFMYASMFFMTLFQNLIYKLSLESLLSVLTAVFLISESIFFKQLVVMYSPLMALTIGFVIYIPAVSSFFIMRLYRPNKPSVYADLAQNIRYCGGFSFFSICIFLFRDLFGYGTITLPSRTGIAQLVIFHSSEKVSLGTFWASTPGAVLLCGFILYIISYADQNMKLAGAMTDVK